MPVPRPVRWLAAGAGVLACLELGLRLAGWLYLDAAYSKREPPARPGDVTVVCLGESSTIGLWVGEQESYPRQLEARLRQAYASPKIRVVVPPHIGQNTSQMANRFADYLRRYRPRLVVIMAGYNNEWSLAETHVGEFIEDRDLWQVRVLAPLESLRTWRLGRQLALRARDAAAGQGVLTVLGHPELARYPPEAWVYDFARRHRDAFVRLWRSDVHRMLRQARRAGTRVLLMTYHINPTYLPGEEMAAFAQEEMVPIVRNDETFATLVAEGTVGRYLFHDGWHPKANGYALIADGALRAVVEGDLLGLGAPAVPPSPSPDIGPAPPYSGPIEPGQWTAADHLGGGWSWPEGEFRWTDGPRAEVLFRLADRRPRLLKARFAVFQQPGRAQLRRVEVSLNRRPVSRWEVADASIVERAAVLPAEALAEDNVVSFDLPDAAPADSDGRRLGIAVRSLRLEELSPLEVGHTVRLASAEAAAYLAGAWSWGEETFRWTDGAEAALAFRLPRPAGGVAVRARPYLAPPAHARQRVRVLWNGHQVATRTCTVADPETWRIPLSPALVGEAAVLTFELPDSTAPASLGAGRDPRRLGLAVEWVRLLEKTPR